MNGASRVAENRPWPWFSMTMVNTVPPHLGDGVASVVLSSLQVTAVPLVLLQAATVSAKRGTASRS